MQRQRGELIPIGEIIADLPSPVQAIRDATPHSLHHFTQADQGYCQVKQFGGILAARRGR